MTAPTDVETILDAALSAHAAHDPEAAERLCREVLRADPDHPEAMNLLGVLLQDQGLTRESVALLTRTVEIDPEFPDAFANLARSLRAMSDPDQAVIAARRAIQLDPGLGESWLQLGLALVTLEQHREGIAALREAVARMPDAIDPYIGIAAAARSLNDQPSVMDAWRTILRLEPERTDVAISLATALMELDQLDEALVLIRRAVEQAPDDTGALTTFAHILHRRFDAAELVSVCRRIVAVEPERLDILVFLANGLTWMGQFEEVKSICETARALHPDHPWFGQQLGVMVPLLLDPNETALCQAQLQDATLPVRQRVSAGFALGRALEEAMQFDAAFEAFRTANDLLHAAYLAEGRRFDVAELQRYGAFVRNVFTPALFHSPRWRGNPSELPVFIVGMPRSGTSLVEQIAASHPRVFGAGERKEIMGLLTRVNNGQNFVSPTQNLVSQNQWDHANREAAAHLDLLRTLGGDADRVIDKLPDNIQMLGQIRVLFPNARIIICRRDLRDVCLSCYTTHFGEDLIWSCDLEECAARAVEIERMTDHWRSVLPGPVLEIHYEALVADLEAESRRLIAFLGLDWDPACLEFHKTDRPVTTASLWQVRQPLYASSVGRWRRYRAHLGPMLKGLIGHLPEDMDSAAGAAD